MASRHRRKVRAERGQSQTRQNLQHLAMSSKQAYAALDFEQRKLRFVIDSLVEVLGIEEKLQDHINEKVAKAKAAAEAAKAEEAAAAPDGLASDVAIAETVDHSAPLTIAGQAEVESPEEGLPAG